MRYLVKGFVEDQYMTKSTSDFVMCAVVGHEWLVNWGGGREVKNCKCSSPLSIEQP